MFNLVRCFSFCLTQNHDPILIERRLQDANKFIAELCKVPGVMCSKQFHEFIETSKHITDFNFNMVKGLTPLTSYPHRLPVSAIHFSLIGGVVVLGYGSQVGGTGAVEVYELAPTRSPINESSVNSSGADWLDEALERQLRRMSGVNFNTGVTSVCFHPARRLVFVGLASGLILLFHCPYNCQKMVFCREINFHKSPPLSMSLDFSGQYLSSVSKASRFMFYNLVDSHAVSQLATPARHQFTSIAADCTEWMVFVGTNRGTVLFYDSACNPPRLLHELPAPVLIPNVGETLGLHFDENSRLLYFAHWNKVYVYAIRPKQKASSSVLYVTLEMANNCPISTVKVINNGNLVAIGAKNGAVCVYDLSDKSAPGGAAGGGANLGIVQSASALAAQNTLKLFTSASSKLTPWEVVKMSNGAIRDWLRANGLDSNEAVDRVQLIRLVLKSANLTPEASCDVFKMPKRKYTEADVAFTWNFNDYLASASSQPASASAAAKTTRVLISLEYLHDMKSFMGGFNDGSVALASLVDFLGPISQEETGEVAAVRRLFASFPPVNEVEEDDLGLNKGPRHIVE